MSSLKKNFIYQTGYQILATILPLITSPYLSRTLGATGQGIYSFIATTVNYFVLFQKIGVDEYGSKSIAEVRVKGTDQSKIFWEIYCMQIGLSIIALVAYFIYIYFASIDNLDIFLIEGLLIINGALDINWYFFGREEFKITVSKNICIKVVSIFLIFIFVKQPDDLWKYSLIICGGTLLSEVVLFINLKRTIHFVKIKVKNVFLHLRYSVVLFIPLLAMSIYHQMDKTMLGLLSTYTELGYYYNVDKIINILIGVVMGFGIVMLPRATQMISKGNEKEYIVLLNRSFELVMFLCSAISFGISSISKEFIPYFFGQEFIPCIALLKVLAFVIFFKSWSTIARNQFLIPANKNFVYIISVIIGAVVNFIINYILIKRYGAFGAVIGTMIAEALVSFIQFAYMNKFFNMFFIILRNIIYVIAGAIMFIVVRLIANEIVINQIFIKILLEIIIGTCIYIFICLIWWIIKKNGLFYDNIILILSRSKKY